MSEFKHTAGIRLPLSLVQEMAEVTTEIGELGLGGLPHSRTDFIIQAVRAYLPVIRTQVAEQRQRLGVGSPVQPVGVRGQLGRLS